jgi:LuxR family maltose regulon positive regulatory protein
MAVPILKTKLYIPPLRPELVVRDRLIERLKAGIRTSKLTLVSAPAGFGKTTLLSEWIQGAAPPSAATASQSIRPHAAWVSLDDGDNDPVRFWTYVLTALRTIPSLRDAGVGASALSMLASPQPPPVEAVLTDLINELAEATGPTGGMRDRAQAGAGSAPPPGLEGQIVLVLDDFHVITNAQVTEALAFLIDHMPPHMHVVIATRADPVLPLSRLRGRGQLIELGAADLRFTPQETATLLNQVMDLGLSTQHVSALEARTEGWAVGLQMAAHALQGTVSTAGGDAGQVSQFISAFAGSHRYVLDYLTDEVLLREPQGVQDFLLRTSILKRLCGPLCDAVTGQNDGQGMLEGLEAANLFVVPLDSQRHWYRYHHLFADLLTKRLTSLHADLLPELHRRASTWHERSGTIEEAIAHAISATDFERAARLVEQHAVQQMMSYRRESTLGEWLQALPEELVRARPWLCVYLGWTRHWMGMRDQVEEPLQCAEEGLARKRLAQGEHEEGADRREPLIAGYIAAIRAHHALVSEQIPRALEMGQQAIGLLPEGDYMRCEAAVALGGAYWALGNVEAAQGAFSQARATAQRSGYPPVAVPSACYVAMQQAKRGQLREAFATYQEALDWAMTPSGRPLPVAGFPLIKLGDLSREWNDLDAAQRDLDRGLELCIQLGHADVLAEAYVMLARLQLALDDLEGAQDSLARADQIAGGSIDPWIETFADRCRLRLWLSSGNLAAAIHWAEKSGLQVEGPLDYQRDLHHTNLARVLLARGVAQARETDLAAALELLERLSAAAKRAGWVSTQIEVLILQALGLQARGADLEALPALERALVLAQHGGWMRTFLDEGQRLVPLLRQAAERGTAPSHAALLLAAAEGRSAPGEQRVSRELAALVEPLSDRELEVLRLIAQGLTNREVAQRLFIAQGTVKAHASSIYGKLGVNNRAQAVAQATALGLL